MSITTVNSVARLPATGSQASGAGTVERQASPATDAQLNEFTQQPRPPRFPWLSRLSLQLEAASQQRAAFAPAPPLGDHVDQSA
jgi:hypothetical protein